MASTLEQLTDVVREHIGDPLLKFNVGRKLLAEHGTPPRVTWVPIGGQILPARRNGPIHATVQGRKVALFPIYQDVITLEAHIWAETFERLETLQRVLLSATKDLFGTDSEPGQYQIETEGARSGHAHGDMAKAIQIFTWSTLVARTQVVTPGPDAGPKVPTRLLVQTLNQTHACSIDNGLTT